MRFKPRVCKHCGRPLGTLAYRYRSGGQTLRDYFHRKCFKIFLKKLGPQT